MGACYYTETTSGPQFQIRVPADLKSHLAFSSLSVPLKPAPKLALRCRALDLAGAARRLFAELRAMNGDELKKLPREDLVRRIEGYCDTDGVKGFSDQSAQAVSQRNSDINGLLAATAELFQRPPPVLSLADRMPSLPVKGLITLHRRHSEGGYLVDAELDACLERLFQAAMGDVDLRALMAGMPRQAAPVVSATRTPPEPVEDAGDHANALAQSIVAAEGVGPSQSHSDTEGLAEAANKSRRLAPASSRKTNHCVSAAFAEYRADLVARKGPDNENVANIDSRARMFHALCGDPDICQLTNQHLKDFAYAISYLPARVARDGSWSPETLKEILEKNGWVDRTLPGNAEMPSRVREQTIGERTWKAKTFGPVKTAIKQYAGSYGIRLLIADFRLNTPAHMNEATDREKPPTTFVDELLQHGFDDGRLVQAMMPLLGALTGRRLALLAHLRAEHFEKQSGHWLAWAEKNYVDEHDGVLRQCRIKTAESKRPFVLHQVFKECGFIDYVTRLGKGWVFPSLHVAGIIDPGATAQKRMDTLTKRVRLAEDVDPGNQRGRSAFVFHCLRHHLTGELRQEKLGDRIGRKQTGRAPADAHDRYAYAFEPSEIADLATRRIDGFKAVARLRHFDIERAAELCLAHALREQQRKASKDPE